MADHIIVTASGGATKTLQTKDNTTFHTPAHQIVREDGTVPLKIVAEDAASASGDSGIAIMVVRADTPGNASGTDGDYEPLQMSAGRLWVSAITTSLVPGVAATSLGKAEDAVAASGDTGVAILGVRRDAAACSAGTDGDYATINQDASGRLWVRSQEDGPAYTSVFGIAGAAFSSADASGAAAAVTSAPTSGQKLVITDLLVSVGTTMLVTFTEETSGTVIAALHLLANTSEAISLRGKLKLATADKKLMVQTSAAGVVKVSAGYYSEA